jgi:hypothetical protein
MLRLLLLLLLLRLLLLMMLLLLRSVLRLQLLLLWDRVNLLSNRQPWQRLCGYLALIRTRQTNETGKELGCSGETHVHSHRPKGPVRPPLTRAVSPPPSPSSFVSSDDPRATHT